MFLHCFARLQNCTNLKNAESLFFHIVVVFLSEHESDKFRDSFKIIKEHVHNPSLNLNKTGLFQKWQDTPVHGVDGKTSQSL